MDEPKQTEESDPLKQLETDKTHWKALQILAGSTIITLLGAKMEKEGGTRRKDAHRKLGGQNRRKPADVHSLQRAATFLLPPAHGTRERGKRSWGGKRVK